MRMIGNGSGLLGLAIAILLAAAGCSQVGEVVSPANDAQTPASAGTPGGAASAAPGGSDLVDQPSAPRPGAPGTQGSLTVEVTLSGCSGAESAELTGVVIVAFDAEGGVHEVGSASEARLSCAPSATFAVTTDLPAGDYTALELRAESAVVRTSAGDLQVGAFALRSSTPFAVDEGGHTEVSLAIQLAFFWS